MLREAVAVLLDSAVADGEMRKTILTRILEFALHGTVTQFANLESAPFLPLPAPQRSPAHPSTHLNPS